MGNFYESLELLNVGVRLFRTKSCNACSSFEVVSTFKELIADYVFSSFEKNIFLFNL